MTIPDDIPPVIWGHPAHRPDHKLKLVSTDDGPYKCDGCLEPGHGAGTRYRCEHERCNFDLHTCCAGAEPTVTHRMFGGTTFVFLQEPPGGTSTGIRRRGRVCDACGDPVLGFVYHSFDEDLDLHPCCARLPESLLHADGRVFQLRRKPSSSSRPCGMCDADGARGGRRRRRRDFWAYRSRVDGEDMDLHVACMKKMARLSWEAQRQSRVDGGQIVQLPNVDRMLQSLPRRTRNSTGFQRLWKMVGAVVSVIIAVMFGNPVMMVTAIAGPGGLLRS